MVRGEESRGRLWKQSIEDKSRGDARRNSKQRVLEKISAVESQGENGELGNNEQKEKVFLQEVFVESLTETKAGYEGWNNLNRIQMQKKLR